MELILEDVYEFPEYSLNSRIVFGGMIKNQKDLGVYKYGINIQDNPAFWHDVYGMVQCRYLYLVNYFGVNPGVITRG